MSCIRLFQESVRKYPARPALLEGSRVTTFGELAKLGEDHARKLAKAGVKKGDRIVVLIPMSVDLYAWIVGLLLLDATILFIEPWMPLPLLTKCLEKAKPRAVLASPLGIALAQKSPAFRAIPQKWASGLAWPFRIFGWQGLSLPDPGGAPGFAPSAGGDDEAVLTFTTGSSGTPKGVVRTHSLLEVQHEILTRSLHLGPDSVCLHVFANFILNNLAAGAASVIPPIRASEPTRFSAAKIVAAIREARVTSIVCPPASLDRMVTWCEARGVKLDTVRSLGTGGGPVPDSLLSRTAAVFPSCDPEVLYGSSEVEPVSHIAWSELKAVSGEGACVGRPVGEAKVRLWRSGSGEAGDVPRGAAGEHGEVIVSGPHVSPRYFQDPEAMAATKIADPDGTLWHRMGDLARLDESGRLWLTGRLHTIIQTAQGPVLPLPVERALEKNGAVAAAAVVGSGDRALAIIEPRLWRPESFETWRAELLGAAPAVADVRFVRAIPRDPRHRSKIDYTRLRAMFAPRTATVKDARPLLLRFAQYVWERYPPIPAALLAGLWAAGAFAVSGGTGETWRPIAASAVVFLFLFALRLADERKDAKRDAELHPDRAVPRGLVTLRELLPAEMAAWIAQAGLALALGVTPFLAWLAVFAYGMLMRVEFFAGEYLESRPFLYALTHQPVVLVLNAFLLFAFGALPRELASAPILLYQGATLAAMFAYELSRKFRAPEAEDPRDNTYGAVHGPVLPAIVAAILAAASGVALGRLLGPQWYLVSGLALPAALFAANPSRSFAKLGAAAATLLLIVVHGALVIQLWYAM